MQRVCHVARGAHAFRRPLRSSRGPDEARDPAHQARACRTYGAVRIAARRGAVTRVRELRLDLRRPASPGASSIQGPWQRLSECRTPFVIGASEESIDTLSTISRFAPTGEAITGTPAGHILNQLIPALASLPWFVRERHDSDIKSQDVGDLGRLRPWSDSPPVLPRAGVREGRRPPTARCLARTKSASTGLTSERYRPYLVTLSIRRLASSRSLVRRPGTGRYPQRSVGTPLVSHQRAGALCEIVVADYNDGCPAHYHIDLLPQKEADDRARVQLVPMIYGVVIVDDVRDPQPREQALAEGGKPREEFVLYPHEIKSRGTEEAPETEKVSGCNLPPSA